MSDSPSGVSAAYVNSAISSLRSELHSEIEGTRRSLERELQREVNRLEAEMREIGSMIVSAIEQQTSRLSNHIDAQTAATVATTVVLESTKQQLATDFSETRVKIDMQTESALQIEVGKKISDGVAMQAKLTSFAKDIKSRFNKGFEVAFLNRQLYNVNFKKIFDEYQNKIRTIGEHIFLIRDSDIKPAVEAAQTPLSEIHGLPIEVDLLRLQIRKQNLDETLAILKESRLDQIINSLDNLDAAIQQRFKLPQTSVGQQTDSLVVIGLLTDSALATDLFIGHTALPVSVEQSVNLAASSPDLAPFSTPAGVVKAKSKVDVSKIRNLDPSEITSVFDATTRLFEKGLISEESVSVMQDFIASGNLKFVG